MILFFIINNGASDHKKTYPWIKCILIMQSILIP